jgi:hypothetical protein
VERMKDNNREEKKVGEWNKVVSYALRFRTGRLWWSNPQQYRRSYDLFNDAIRSLDFKVMNGKIISEMGRMWKEA